MKKKVWIVSELFYPETISTGYIMTEIAESLAKNHSVSVIAGPKFYEKNNSKTATYLLDSIDIIRIDNKGYNKNNLFSRLLGHIKITYSMLRLMKNNIPNGSEILMVTNPILLVVLTSFLIKKKKWIIKLIVHDVYPENLIVSGILKSNNSIIYKVLNSLFKRSFGKYDTLVVLGRDMKELFLRKIGKNANIVIIENWSDIINIKPAKSTNTVRSFIFAGNMGRVQGIDILMESLTNINEEFKFTFIGSGTMESFIEKFIKEYDLSKIYKLSWQAREKTNEFLEDADIGVISLSKGMFGLGVPSKLYNLLAAGKPILYIGDENSEIYNVLNENEIGWYAQSGNQESIVNIIEEIIQCNEEKIERLSRNSRRLAENKYSKEIILEKYQNLLF